MFVPGYKAVATLYNALMTGLVLTLVSRKGEGVLAVHNHHLRLDAEYDGDGIVWRITV